MAKPLTEKDKVDVWRRRIERAKEIRRREYEEIWAKNLLAYRGKLRPHDRIWNPDDPWISIELVHSAIRASIPSLLYHNPKFTITPTQPEYTIDPQTGEQVDISWEKARSKELWLQHVWQETEANKHIRLALIAGFLAFGSCKVGYMPTFMDDKKRGEFAFDKEGNPIVQGTDRETGLPILKLEKGEYLKDEDGKIIFDLDTGVPVLHPGTLQHEDFFVEFAHWDTLLFDNEAGNVFKNHRWFIEEWTRPLDEVRNDPRFAPNVRKNIQATHTVSDTETPTDEVNLRLIELTETTSATHDDEARVRGFDIYDFVNNRYMVLADEATTSKDRNDAFLLDIEMPVGLDHGPHRFLKFNEDPGRWYPKTDAEAMAKVELEYNLTRSQMATHRNQSRTRYAEYNRAGFDGDDGGDLEREKFASGPSGTIVRLRERGGVEPIRKDAMDGTFFTSIPNILADFSQVAGQPGELRGVADAETATQASILQSGVDIRNNDRRDNLVQTFLSEIGRALLQSAAANAEKVKWVKIARGPQDPHPFDFQEINPEDLKGEFQISVAMGSTQPKNSSTRVALYERVMLTISQNPVIAASPTLMRRLFEAIDLSDEKLIAELQRIGEAALKGMSEASEGEGGVGDQEIQAEIANQAVSGVANTQAGVSTGARLNGRA